MWFLALRHLRSRPYQTLLTLLGVFLGGTAYIVFASMMLGFQEEIVDTLLNLDAQVRISPKDKKVTPELVSGMFGAENLIDWVSPPAGNYNNSYLTNVGGWYERLDADERVAAFAPQLIRFGMVNRSGVEKTISMIGIDVEKQSRVTKLADYMIQGDYKDIGRGNAQVLIGATLADKLAAKRLDILELVTPQGQKRLVKVAGIYQTGNPAFEESVMYASIQVVQELFSATGEISDIVISLFDVQESYALSNDLAQWTDDKVESWEQAHDDIVTMFLMQDLTRNTVSGIIVVVVAFGIFNILNMSVNQKKRDIAILRSTGFAPTDTSRLFIYQGLILGLAGALIALGAGYAGSAYIDQITVSTPMSTGTMNVSWDPAIYVQGFCLSCFSAILAAWFPARAAARLTPIDIIRASA